MDAERLLIAAFASGHPSDAARILERLPAEEAAALLTGMPGSSGGEVLRRMSAFGASAAIAAVNPKSAAALAAQLPLQDAAALLRRVPQSVCEDVLAALPGEMREHLRVLLRYPDGTAGALMDPLVLVLPDDLSVGEALARTRRRARNVYFYIYVTDRNHQLLGVLDLRELLLANATETLAAVMRTELVKVRAETDMATIEAHPGWQEYDALPVVDERGIFLGAIRHRVVRRSQSGDGVHAGGAGETMLSLAELYWIGIGGMLRGLTGAIAPEGSEGGRNDAR
jgi:Mg/Co/Ni transporter MgtE